MQVKNETDETIVLEPGESLQFRGERGTRRSCVSRIPTFTIEEVKLKTAP